MEKLECLPHNDANSCSILRGADVTNNSLGQGISDTNSLTLLSSGSEG